MKLSRALRLSVFDRPSRQARLERVRTLYKEGGAAKVLRAIFKGV